MLSIIFQILFYSVVII